MTAQVEPSASSASRRSGAGDAGDRLLACWSVVGPFVLVGSVCIVAGGLVAAVSRPSGFELGSWLAAYLVLVGGVAEHRARRRASMACRFPSGPSSGPDRAGSLERGCSHNRGRNSHRDAGCDNARRGRVGCGPGPVPRRCATRRVGSGVGAGPLSLGRRNRADQHTGRAGVGLDPPRLMAPLPGLPYFSRKD